MKLIFTASLLFISLFAFAQTKQETEIILLSAKKFDWLVTKQYDSLVARLDDQLQYIHSNGWTENKNELLEDLKSGKLEYQNIQVHSASVRFFEATAILTGRGKFQAVMNGSSLQIELSYTEVYVMKNGKWLLASRHANRMP